MARGLIVIVFQIAPTRIFLVENAFQPDRQGSHTHLNEVPALMMKCWKINLRPGQISWCLPHWILRPFRCALCGRRFFIVRGWHPLRMPPRDERFLKTSSMDDLSILNDS